MLRYSVGAILLVCLRICCVGYLSPHVFYIFHLNKYVPRVLAKVQ